MTTAAPVGEAAFGTVFGHALRGEDCHLVIPDVARLRVPVDDWTRRADADDRGMLDHCTGPTIDIGCGPGRLTAELIMRGHMALGIDLVHEAVWQTRERGGIALRRDVFQPLPGEGRWQTALLADGNVGIGGNPVALLRRVHQLLHPEGVMVVEVAPHGVPTQVVIARLECGCARTAPFRWAVVGLDGVADVAERAGLAVTGRARYGDRWCVTLEAAS